MAVTVNADPRALLIVAVTCAIAALVFASNAHPAWWWGFFALWAAAAFLAAIAAFVLKRAGQGGRS